MHPQVRSLSVPGSMAQLNSWLDTKVTLPQAGYIMVRVWGSGFMGGTDYRCAINDNPPIPATYDGSLDAILCWSDLWRGARGAPRDSSTNLVEVTLNGQQYTKDNVSIPINFFW
jgi:hypothetical protein